ncbi:hypothetical protein ACFWDN_21220 [Micromonospora chalcea]
MPLIVSRPAGGVYTPPVVAPDPYVPLFPPLDTTRPTAVYIDPTGVEWPLSDPGLGWATIDEVDGLGAVEYELSTDPHPRGGSRVRHSQPVSRIVNWPLLVWGDTHVEFLARWRALARAFTLSRRLTLPPGRLRVYRPDGSAREILVRYQGGFKGEPGYGFTEDTAIAVLYAEDPYWRDVAPVTLSYGTAAPRRFLSPFPSVSSGNVLGEAEVWNPGDAEAWPEWTLTGPCDGITATNHTTGEAFTLTYPLAAGQTVTITTEPPTVRGPAGQVLTWALNWPGAVLWGLAPGPNDVDFAVTGTQPGTAVDLSFVSRYETA